MGLTDANSTADLGPVPNGWDVLPLGELLTFQNGVNADKGAYGRGIRFANVLEVITNTHLRTKQIPGRVALPPQVQRSYAVRAGDILFNRTSETQEELGLAAVYADSEEIVFGGFVIRGQPRSDRLNPTYAGYGLRAPSVRSQIIARGQGAIRANIGQSQLSSVLIALPPRAEQEAIAEALSDADALIESLEKLIAKKRLIKQGAMQELLTGKRRLPGFENKPGAYDSEIGFLPRDWECVRLTSVARLESGHTPSRRRPDYWTGDIPWISLHDTANLEKREIFNTAQTIGELGLANSSARLLPKGTVVFSRTATIGKVSVMGREMCTSQDFANYVCGERLHNHFLAYIFRGMTRRWEQLMAGSTHNTIYMPVFEQLQVQLPAIDEQQAIAKVLADMDGELDALREQLEKARMLKQGMMHNLLTGKIRLA